MEDKQFNQLFDLITRCEKGVRELQISVEEIKNGQGELKTDVADLKTDVAELKTDVAELKTDVAELKEGQQRLEAGQARLEKEIETTNRALNTLAGESIRIKARVDVLEEKEFSN